ncbi:MAG: hypothetical protein HQL67_08405 [Magnetococcales bacterium]|nr:hypothetical protein [Magnetococcales bacterium]
MSPPAKQRHGTGPLRLRILLLAGTILLTLLGWQRWFYEPFINEWQQIEQKKRAVEKRMTQLRNLKLTAQPTGAVDPGANQAIESQREQQLNQALRETGIYLTRADQRQAIQTALLTLRGPLQFTALHQKNSTTTVIIDPPKGEKPPRLVQHQWHIQLTGTYAQTWHYLKRIEQADLPLLWQSLSYRTATHPDGQIDLQINALSLTP